MLIAFRTEEHALSGRVPALVYGVAIVTGPGTKEGERAGKEEYPQNKY